ncbi:hypothetical protein WJX72_008516 [[Myrmecia] bisecta]|uniref:Glutathione synthetase n=1 Tax=[Myrmecia] bisecta TaxID=41462 RepID=A0AAW1Q3J3_9CHLO
MHALADDAIIWATQHGLVVGAGISTLPLATIHAPLAVLPVPFPRASFQKAKDAMTIFNLVIDRISRDSTYLQQTLAAAAEYDDFTAKLLEVYRDNLALWQSRASSELVLGIHRSDYMLDEPSSTLLQVELNTIASSFGCLSTLTGQMHRYILERSDRPNTDPDCLPSNNAMNEIADAIGAAAREYGVDGAVALMVVQPGERNAYDQQWIQTTVWERHKVRMIRRTLREISEQGQLSSSGRLSIAGHPIAVAYFRAGYSPTDYPSQAEWDARGLLERSDAAQCPSVAYQLTGAKKIQQDLARPGVLERFLDHPDQVRLLRACFAGLWGLDDLDDPDTMAVLAEARTHPELFVLKPQREGGGNNLYGPQLLAKLDERRGLAAYILMQRIRPPSHRAAMIREGKVVEVDSLSELGIYGTFLRRGDQVLLNRESGHLVRTKASTSDEGGVAAGFAVLDSPYLTD